MAWWIHKATPRLTRAPSGADADRAMMTTNVPDTLPLMQECCANGAPAVVMFDRISAMTSFQARFFKADAETISVELILPRSGPAPEIPKKAPACAAFTYGRRAHVFLSSVVRFTPPRSEPARLAQVVMQLPQLVVEVEARTAFRVAVFDDCDLKVTVSDSHGSTWSPKPLDVSLTGMLLVFPAEKDPRFAKGSRVNVALQLGDNDVTLAGKVVPRGGRALYGVYFPEVLRGSQIVPPPELRAIFTELDRLWLERQWAAEQEREEPGV